MSSLFFSFLQLLRFSLDLLLSLWVYFRLSYQSPLPHLFKIGRFFSILPSGFPPYSSCTLSVVVALKCPTGQIFPFLGILCVVLMHMPWFLFPLLPTAPTPPCHHMLPLRPRTSLFRYQIPPSCPSSNFYGVSTAYPGDKTSTNRNGSLRFLFYSPNPRHPIPGPSCVQFFHSSTKISQLEDELSREILMHCPLSLVMM